MNIGDRVRLVHGREEGIITKFLPGDIVEVEIEDGFRIPVQKREVALVSPEEKNRFRGVEPAQTERPRASEIVANQGLYLAFIPVNDREMTLYVINNTDWDIPFTLTNGAEPHFRSLAAGSLKGRSSLKAGDWLVKDFESWGVFTVQALFSRPAFMQLRAPLEKKLRFRAATFFKTTQRVPVLDKSGHLFQLDGQEPVRAEQLKASLEGAPKADTLPDLPKPEETVDLHIEKLTRDFLALDPLEILDLQLKTFEKALENAIAHGVDEITFIHGVGNGTLRTELHRKLGKHPHVAYFSDARKEKFGYGATLVRIK